MSFIQVQQSLVTHRKTLRLARLLSLDRYAVVGRLVALWSWCLDNALDGALGDDIDADVLADVMAFGSEMGKPALLLDALLTAGFLDLDDVSDPGHPTLRIHDWHEHMGRLIEKRAADAERHRLSRAAAAQAKARAAADVSSSDEPDDGDDGDEDVMRTSRGRHADVMRQSRVEKKRVSPTGQGDLQERETHTGEHAGPNAGTRQARALSRASPASTSSTSPTTGARVPDVVWDACIASMGSPPSNSVERGKWARGIKALKESLLSQAGDSGELTIITAQMAAEIGVRCLRYRKRFGTSVPLNPMALAGNWSALAVDITPSSTSWEGQRHGQSGNFTQSTRSSATQAGRSGGRGGRAGGRPAIGTAAYYAQASVNHTASTATGQGGTSSTARDGGGVAREGGATAATLAIG